MKRINKKPYTKADIEVIEKFVQQAKENGEKLGTGLKRAAAALKRTPGAVGVKYYSHVQYLKDKNKVTQTTTQVMPPDTPNGEERWLKVTDGSLNILPDGSMEVKGSFTLQL